MAGHFWERSKTSRQISVIHATPLAGGCTNLLTIAVTGILTSYLDMSTTDFQNWDVWLWSWIKWIRYRLDIRSGGFPGSSKCPASVWLSIRAIRIASPVYATKKSCNGSMPLVVSPILDCANLIPPILLLKGYGQHHHGIHGRTTITFGSRDLPLGTGILPKWHALDDTSPTIERCVVLLFQDTFQSR